MAIVSGLVTYLFGHYLVLVTEISIPSLSYCVETDLLGTIRKPGAFHLERLRSDMTSGMRMKSFAELSARQRSVLD